LREVRLRERRRHGGYLLIPAGALIGLGAGMLVGQPGAGVLIGLGLGLLAAAFVPAGGRLPEGAVPGHMSGPRWTQAMVGVFLMLVGLAVIWGPALPWTTIIAVLIIVLGLGFIARGFGRMG